jgi:hypothetical protein
MKHVFLAVMGIMASVICFAQSVDQGVDKKVRFGFNIGTTYANPAVEPLPANTALTNSLGFKSGLLMEYDLTDNLILSPKVELGLYNSSVTFTTIDTIIAYRLFPVSLELMAHAVYKIGKGRARPYLLIGPNVKLPLNNIDVIGDGYNTKTDVALDLGVGWDFGTRYFTVAPEIRYSLGLRDINESPQLQSIRFHTLSLLLNFK